MPTEANLCQRATGDLRADLLATTPDGEADGRAELEFAGGTVPYGDRPGLPQHRGPHQVKRGGGEFRGAHGRPKALWLARQARPRDARPTGRRRLRHQRGGGRYGRQRRAAGVSEERFRHTATARRGAHMSMMAVAGARTAADRSAAIVTHVPGERRAHMRVRGARCAEAWGLPQCCVRTLCTSTPGVPHEECFARGSNLGMVVAGTDSVRTGPRGARPRRRA